jgi:two-component system, NtrC family, response regulator GlrR
MNSRRVLILDMHGLGFWEGPFEHLLSISHDNQPETFYFPAFLSQKEKRTETLIAVLSSIEPDSVFLFGPHSPLVDAFSVVEVLARLRASLEKLVIREHDRACIFRIQHGRIHGTEIVSLVQDADHSLVQRLKERIGLRNLVGNSRCFISEVKKIPQVADVDATVLLSGETGTGKEMFARTIHYLSPRRDKPFITINCGAIPADLLENEFFGHEIGAYTGAATRSVGLVEQCEGGTLFLDEVDCIPLLAQTKVLRLIQEKEYKPLGSTRVHTANIRIISATNTEPMSAVKEGKIRQDLYYRLNVIPIKLPSLRERMDDIPLLARHFLAKYAKGYHKEVDDFSPEATAKLMSYHWPGNVRQLEHEIERAVIFSHGTIITERDICGPEVRETIPESLRSAKSKAVEQCERNYIEAALAAQKGNVTRAAKASRKNPRAFRHLIHKYEIDLQKYRV